MEMTTGQLSPEQRRGELAAPRGGFVLLKTSPHSHSGPEVGCIWLGAPLNSAQRELAGGVVGLTQKARVVQTLKDGLSRD